MVEPAALELPAGQLMQLVAPVDAAKVLAGQIEHASVAPLPKPAWPAAQTHVLALGPLALLLWHDELEAAPGALYEPARQLRHAEPVGLYDPAAHAKQVSDAPVPAVARPGRHVHVVAPVPLVLPSVQLEHNVAPAVALKVLEGHAVHVSDAPLPLLA